MKFTKPEYHIYTTTGNGKAGGNNVITQNDMKEQGVLYSDVIVKSIEALGEIGDASCVSTLVEVLKDPEDGSVRCAAAIALGKLGDNGAVPGLIEALNDQYWYCRRDAAKALGQLKDERAIEPLSVKLADTYDEVREFALKALINIGPAATKALFSAFLKQPKNVSLQAYIKETLSKDDVINLLTELLETESDTAKRELYEKYLVQFRGT